MGAQPSWEEGSYLKGTLCPSFDLTVEITVEIVDAETLDSPRHLVPWRGGGGGDKG